MTDDQHGEGTPQGGGRWDPLPQGDYDDGATAFVKLPEGGIDALLAAPGHGYVPPQITVAPGVDPGADPAAGGTWAVQDAGAQWPDPNAVPRGTGAEPDDRFTYNPAATQHWTYDEPVAPPAPGHDVTGEWSIPVAGGDLPDESGEFTTSSLVEQWGAGGNPPATLPGGAPAPWATEGPGQPWGQQTGEVPTGHPGHPVPEHSAHEEFRPAATYPEHPAEQTPEPAQADGPEAAPDTQEAAQAPDGLAGSPADPETDEGPADEPEVAQEAATADEAAPPDETPAPGPAAADEATPPPPHDEHPLASYVLRVNDTERPVTDAWIGESLLYVLRERLGLAGAKDGCSQGECGACNVQVDGRLVASCLVPAVTAAGSEVRTVEGLAVDGRPSDVQRALARCGAVQCGFCVPGMAMTVHDLLEGNPAPTDLEARQALCGNLCRCSGYRGVLDAVQEVVAEREAHTAAETETDTDGVRIPHQAGPGAGGVNTSAFDSPGTFGGAGGVFGGSGGTFGGAGGAFGGSGPHDQHYGQDGGQA
ncbi:2Fe-2S iron-sulfur cluster-binding protein [Streptomyces sp. NPDC001843]|uniref:2Fe-2S iron-sulfur cluster-binding protein n=1 Tax=Streptomyces sp. NPDC001843 TaxID=3364617 RepID=UPI003696EBD1